MQRAVRHRKIIVLLFAAVAFALTAGAKNAFAHYFIVQDSDGHANVRGAQNKIIDRVDVGTIVWEAMPDFEWSGQDDFTYVAYGKGDKIYLGNIHTSRLKRIDDSFPAILGKDNSITLEKEAIVITIRFTALAENVCCGTAYESIRIKMNDTEISLPKKAYADLRDLNPRHAGAQYDAQTQSLYIMSAGGDGAEGYTVLWAIRNGKYAARHIAIIVPDPYVPLSQKGISIKDFYGFNPHVCGASAKCRQ